MAALMEALLRAAPPDVIPAGRAVLAASLEAAVADLVSIDEPALTHGDLWLENVLLRDGSVYRVLDFEHAQFLDPLYDFGKPDELVFERWPTLRSEFIDGYQSVRPLPADAEQRVALYRGFQFLYTLVYFAKRSPQFLPEYQDRLVRWTLEHPATG